MTFYVGDHDHKHGTDAHLFQTDQIMTKADFIDVLGDEYEPDSDEWVSFQCVIPAEFLRKTEEPKVKKSKKDRPLRWYDITWEPAGYASGSKGIQVKSKKRALRVARQMMNLSNSVGTISAVLSLNQAAPK